MNSGVSKNFIRRDTAPQRDFSLPQEVVDDPGLSTKEKRTILCRWASDSCAVPSFPALRLLPGTTFPVTFTSIMDALAQLDQNPRRSSTQQRSSALNTARVVIADFAHRRHTHHL
jgi:hypothetical protein